MPTKRLWLGLLAGALLLSFAPLAPSRAEPVDTAAKPETTLAEAQTALDEMKRLAAQAPDNAALQRALAGAYLRFGDVLKSQGKLDEALEQLLKGLAIVERAVKQDAGDTNGQYALWRFEQKIGDVLNAQGATAEALKYYRHGLAIARRLAQQDPAHLESQRNLAASYTSIGAALASQGHYAEALVNYQQSLAIANRLSQNDPGDSNARAELNASQERIRETVGKLSEQKQTGAASEDSEMIVGGKPQAMARPPSTALPLFPWPPPRASAAYVLPDQLLAGYHTVGGVAQALLSALETNGYVERSFYETSQGGVALVTRLERINEDGSPVADATRWPAGGQRSPSTGDLIAFLRGLFYVDPGHYRVIVFVLQDLPFTQSEEDITSEQARAWLSGGANVLPASLAARSFAGGHCTALIYEFASDGNRVRVVASRLTGKGHLQQAGVLTALDPSH